MRRQIVLRLWLLSASCLSAVAPGALAADDPLASSREELFRAVFGHAPPPIPVESHVTVVVDGASRQRMRAVPAEDGQGVLLEGTVLTAMLSQYVRPELLRELEGRMNSRGLLDRGAIEATGFAATFNPRTFEYFLTTAPAMRVPAVLYLTPPLPDPFKVQAIRPAGFSGFLNFNVKGVSRQSSSATTSLASRTVAIALDGATNLKGVVLEGSAFGQTGAADSWNRGDLRLVYDLPQQALRFTAGDLAHPVIGYQTSVALGGIGLTKDYALQPQALTYWTGDFAFNLDRPAEVKLFSNDSLIGTLQLPAGVHDLRRFTPAVGQNDIDIVIEDSAGRREILHYSFIHDPALLATGLSVYSWNAGFARQLQGNTYHYDTSSPVFSSFYQRGVTVATTLGGYAQAQDGLGLLGIQALHALPVGTLLLDVAGSRSDQAGWDAAARLALTVSQARQRPEAYLAVEYLGARFNARDALPYRPRDALNVQASVATQMARGLTARLSASYYSARGLEAGERYGVAASLFQSWSRYATASLSLRHGRTPGAGTDTELLFGVRVSFTHATGSYQLAKELEHQGMNAHWNSPRPNNASTPYGFATVRTGPDLREYQGGGGYSGNHGMAEVAYLYSTDPDAMARSVRKETSLRLQGALAFAGDEIALSRPIRESFAIVTGTQGLTNVAMKVDPGRTGSSAQSDWLGAAVVPDLSSYRLRNLRVVPVDPPLGATPDNMTFQLAPTYKSGVLLKVGKELRIVAVGRLVDAMGVGIAYQPLQIRRSGYPDELPIETFTGRTGNFQVPDLHPGRYEMHFPASRAGVVNVDIPDTHEGISRLGDIMEPPEVWP